MNTAMQRGGTTRRSKAKKATNTVRRSASLQTHSEESPTVTRRDKTLLRQGLGWLDERGCSQTQGIVTGLAWTEKDLVELARQGARAAGAWVK